MPFLNLLVNPTIPKWLNDLNGDGNPEIEALDATFEFGFGLDHQELGAHQPGAGLAR